MRFSKSLLVLCLIIFVAALGASSALADARINQVHHFGGDVLYCTTEDGCWFVNIKGEPLWEVEQSVITDALADACESGEAQVIEAGAGTYGPSQLVVGCPSSITLVGFDEWGKQNTMQFTPDYQPVNPAPSSLNLCSYYLPGRYISMDGIHGSVGWDIWSTNPWSFIRWVGDDPGLPACESFWS